MQKPELLLPAGNIENLHAALEGGADAVYLGLKQFNAREKAHNFTYSHIKSAVEMMHKHHKRVYVTLNTVIKNTELTELMDVLVNLSVIGPDALIIQDWGVLYLVQHYFEKLELHASTQMGIHNRVGTLHARKGGIKRVILARELTMKEVASIANHPGSHLELLVHGASCYSFSGMCLFSSYLGGSGANRGLCTQPCRRLYDDGEQQEFLFNLKDNQLIHHLPEFRKMGIHSLKVEGRMRSAEYVYRVARAYRMVIDNYQHINEALQLLDMDLGREKTGYFIDGKTAASVSQTPLTGRYAGKVIRKEVDRITIETEVSLKTGNRIRISSPDGARRETIKLRNINQTASGLDIHTPSGFPCKPGDLVYLANLREKAFSSKFDIEAHHKTIKSTVNLHDFRKPANSPKRQGEQLFLRDRKSVV